MRKAGFILTAALLLAACYPSFEARAELGVEVLQQFKQANPRARFYQDGNSVDCIYGTTISVGATPLESAWNHVDRWQGIFGTEIGELVPSPVQGVMYNRDTQDHKFYTFRFNQFYNGVPVFRKGVGFLVRNEPGNPLVMSSSDVQDMQGFQVAAPEGEPEVTGAMLRNVRQLMDAQPVLRSVLAVAPELEIQISDQQHVVWAGFEEWLGDPELAVQFIATRGSVQTYPDYQKFLIVASVAGGEIRLAETQIVNLVDINGSVSGNATDGIKSAECDPESTFRLPYASVNVVGGSSTYADENGDFTIPHGGSNQVSVRSQLRGRWFEVRDQAAGNQIPEITLPVTPPGPVDFLHNPSNTQFPTANVNAYLEANFVRDYVLSFEPTFPVIGTQQFFRCNTNISSTCNAFYDGSSINFYRQGGGCPNTSFSDVIYHEYAHHLVAVTGNGQGQFGEGASDCIGVIIQDDPILAHGWNVGNCNNGLRSADNNIQYPCNGGSHFCGQLISGCIWDTRNELIVTEPVNYQDIGAGLFAGMLIARGQQAPGSRTITPLITIIYLELDDDDGDIGNGTPHYVEIAAGFGADNMDAPPLELDFQYPSGRPDLINPAGGVEFIVEIGGAAGPVPGSGVLHVDRGNGFEDFPMNEISSNIYEANFPPTDCASIVNYYISADISGGGSDADPAGAPDVFYSALSAPNEGQIVFNDDFETNLGWTVSGNATQGRWERGVPVGDGSQGDPPTDADGSGQCYVTGNAPGEDVDSGRTRLLSPSLDASGTAGEPMLSYYRWFHNNVNGSNMDDVFEVEISNNNGSSWVAVETVGPTGPEVSGGWFLKRFKIRDFVEPTDQIRVRFTASDFGLQGRVEAGIDGVSIRSINCNAEPVCADGGTLIEGTGEINDFNSTCGSDDTRWAAHGEVFAFQVSDPVVQFELTATATTGSPGSFSVDVEASKQNDNANLNLRALVFNFETGQYESLPGVMSLTTTDLVQLFELPVGANPSDFVESGSNQVRLLLQTIQSSGVPNVRTQIDEVLFNVN